MRAFAGPVVVSRSSNPLFTQFDRRQGWSEPEHFSCQVDGGPNGPPTPVNLGPVVNTSNNETRGSFWRGETLYFGRAPGPEGSTDIYVTTRQRHAGH
jgi:hypothetical protein